MSTATMIPICPDHERSDPECDACNVAFEVAYVEARAEYEAASPAERRRVIDPQGARAAYREELCDAGRGHLLREDD